MRNICLIFFGLLLTEGITSGQDLISNSSFDEYYNYHDDNNTLVYHPANWFYVDSILNHPLYFSTDRFLNKSFQWNIHPDSAQINQGEIANYISILILPNVHRAYTTLKKPLKQGRKYKISVDIKAFDQSNYFSDLLVGFKDCTNCNMDSSLYQLRLVIPDSLCTEILYHDWFTLSIEFIATGLEKVFLISSGSVDQYKKIIYSDKDKFLIRKYQGPPKLKYYLDNIILIEKEINSDSLFANRIDTLEVGDKIILNNIYFDFDKFELRKLSISELDMVYHYLNENERTNILISGHTDNYGSNNYNDTLSYKRAISILEYLTKKGISGDRLQAEGFGSKDPVDTNSTSVGRQKNRRIEIKIMRK